MKVEAIFDLSYSFKFTLTLYRTLNTLHIIVTLLHGMYKCNGESKRAPQWCFYLLKNILDNRMLLLVSRNMSVKAVHFISIVYNPLNIP